MNNKYEVFIKLLSFNKDKYPVGKVFRDFISLFAITLSNKVSFNRENNDRYEEIYQSYEKEEQFNFYALSAVLTRLFCNEKEPYDILGEIYQKVTNREYLRLINNNQIQEVGRKLQGIVNINKKTNNGRMVEMNCGSGAMILAYASTLKIFKLNYKFDLEVAAIDTDIINVFMTYIQMYFFKIQAVVILMDEKTNKELMRLYTPSYENDMENLMVA
mgnify:CR=1 FL=1